MTAIGLIVTGVIEPPVFKGFTDSNVLLFIAMFIIGAAFLKREWLKVEAYNQSKTDRQLTAVMIITGLCQNFINTGTAQYLFQLL